MRYNCLCVMLVCIALTACLLSACSPHGEKRDETASDQTTQQTVSAYDDVSTDAATGTEIDPQKEQSTPSAESSGQEEITTVTEPDTVIELPEIEIPVDNDPEKGKDNERESTEPEHSGNDGPTSAPSSPEKTQTEPTESKAPESTTEVPPEPTAGTTLPTGSEPDPDTEPGDGGIVIDPNGDILLPEVP